MSHEQILFNPETHTYTVNGQEKPGVTTILQNAGLSPDLSMIDPETLARKATLGKEVHRAIELIFKNDLGEYDPVIEPYIQAARLFISTFNIQPIKPELAIYSASLDCCGTMDLLARYNDNEEGVFDFKTSSTIEIGYVGPQTGGYDFLYREWTNQLRRKPFNRFAVHLQESGKFKVIPCNDPNDLTVFRYACLAQKHDQDYEFYMSQITNWKERFKHASR